MNQTKELAIKATAAAALVASLAMASPALAAVSVGVEGGVGSADGSSAIQATATAGIRASSAAATHTSATNAAARANLGASAVLNANTRANARTGSSSSSSTASTGEATYNTLNGSLGLDGAARSNAFILTRQDIAATSTNVMSASSVSSADDFRSYARTIMMGDTNIAKIAADDSQVAVWYNEPAKILGIIPATVTLEASVDAGGNVAVNYPWWYGMFVRDNAQTQFRTDLSDTAGTIARGEATTTLSSSVKARLVNAIQSILRVRYQSTAGTTTSQTTTY